MCGLGKSTVAFGLVLVIAGSVQAQGQRGGFGGGMMGRGGKTMLLSNKSVQEEIKASSEQTEKLTKLGTSMMGKMREKTQDLSPEERREKGPAIAKEINEEVDKELKDILKAEQLKRFNQIALQFRGAQAFADPEVQAKLNVTDEQKEKLKTIQDDAGTKRREIFQNAGDDRQAAFQKMTALGKETMEKSTAVLTDSQKKTWTEMTGEPFEVKLELRPPQQQ
jgi:hypothetical protein